MKLKEWLIDLAENNRVELVDGENMYFTYQRG